MHLIEKIRTDNKLTRAEMIDRLKIAKSYYSMLVHGNRKISKSLAIKINKEFNIPLEKIFFAESVHVPRKTLKSKAV